MKRVLVLLAAAAFKMSCEKEEELACNCGTITDHTSNNNCYWLEISNDCSGNKKSFCVDWSTWVQAYVGTEFCMKKPESW